MWFELVIYVVWFVLYGFVFVLIVNVVFYGVWVVVVVVVVFVEVGLMLWDFVVEDWSCKLLVIECVLYMLLVVNGGVLFGMVVM